MSERTGIPLSTLAKVEHDRLTLTYDKLQQISQRLNLRMSELFSEADAAGEPQVTAVMPAEVDHVREHGDRYEVDDEAGQHVRGHGALLLIGNAFTATVSAPDGTHVKGR